MRPLEFVDAARSRYGNSSSGVLSKRATAGILGNEVVDFGCVVKTQRGPTFDVFGSEHGLCGVGGREDKVEFMCG